MNELALFAGAGGGLLASRILGWRTVCAVELEPYCREILLRRQRDGLLDLFPIWDDARTFDGEPWRGIVDVVTAGFPCQPFSVAGRQRGEADERNLWPETIRIIRQVGPRYAFLENVQGLLNTREWLQVIWYSIFRTLFGRIRVRHQAPFGLPAYFGRILGDLAESGFDAEWCVLGADDVGAKHRRKRLWILADAAEVGCGARRGRQGKARKRRPELVGGCKDVADSSSTGRQQNTGGSYGDEAPHERWSAPNMHKPTSGRSDVADAGRSRLQERDGIPAWRQATDTATAPPGWWAVEPAVGRVANGVAHRVDRLRAIGNGIGPQQMVAAWRILAERTGIPLGEALEEVTQ